MRAILTIDMDDEKLRKEGVSPEEMLKSFSELKESLASEAPPGCTVTLRLEATPTPLHSFWPKGLEIPPLPPIRSTPLSGPLGDRVE